MKINAWLLVSIGLALLLFFQCKCYHGTSAEPDITGLTHSYDSVKTKSHADSVEYTKHISALQFQLDQQQRLAGITKDSADNIAAYAKYLAAKYRTAKVVRDTIRMVAACDTFINQSEAYYNLNQVYLNQIDSLSRLKDSIWLVGSTEINRLNAVSQSQDKDYQAMTHFFQESSKLLIDANKKAARRFGLSAVGGYGVGNNGLTPLVGVGLSYTIFKF